MAKRSTRTARKRQAKLLASFPHGKSLSDLSLEINKKLPAGVRVIEASPEPNYPSYFAVLAIEGDTETLPAVPDKVVFVGRDLTPLSDEDLVKQRDDAFASVKPYRRCPICWGRDKGKAQPKEKWWRAVNNLKRKYCYACDVCGHRWNVILKMEYEIVDGTQKLIENAEVR